MRRIICIAALLLAWMTSHPSAGHTQSRASATVNVSVVIPPLTAIRSIDTKAFPAASSGTFETTVNVDSNTSFALEFRNSSKYTIELASGADRKLAPGEAYIVYVQRTPGRTSAITLVWRAQGAKAGAEVPLTIMIAPNAGR